MRKITDLISNSTFQGYAALVGLIAAVLSNSWWIRIPALLVLFGFLFALRSLILSGARKLWKFLTWKFLLGMAVGLISAILLNPFLTPISRLAISFAITQVEVLDSQPANGEVLSDLYESIEVRFSGKVRSYRQLMNVEISPELPLRTIWIYNFDPDECCRSFYIYPDKYFPNESRARFDPGETYRLRLSGPLLKETFEMQFRTPEK
ncbi:MAG: hypothetical protein AAFR25_03340 [Cyanobacteria bacterium J06629_19]